MLFNLLNKLFGNDYLDIRYSPKPKDMFVAVLLMGTGIASLSLSPFMWIGILIVLLGFGLGVTILLCMNWEKVIEYWATINEHIKLMEKSRNPDLWLALGYKHVPQSVQIIEQEDKGQGFVTTRMIETNIPPAKMNILANKVLEGKHIFSEAEYSAIVPGYREVKKKWTDKGYLKQIHKDNPRLGHSFTRKGMTMLYQFASDEIKLRNKWLEIEGE